MIPPEWLCKRGKGVSIGVCDTGIETSLACFKSSQIKCREFGTVSKRHGTHIASTIFDFAPDVQMYFAAGVMDSYAKLSEMLEWLFKFELDVLNLSLAFKERDEDILKKLKDFSSKGTLVVCAWAQDTLYPWSEKEFISAGLHGNFKAPNEWMAYSSTGYRTVMKGSSTSAAITSGLCCLGKAIIPEMNKEDFLSLIKPDDVPKYEIPKKQKVLNL